MFIRDIYFYCSIATCDLLGKNDKIHIKSMMNLCLTFDHRIMDGAEASNFMKDVKLELQKIHEDFVH